MKRLYLLMLCAVFFSVATSAKYERQNDEKDKAFNYLKLYHQYLAANNLKDKNPYEEYEGESPDNRDKRLAYDEALKKQMRLNEFKDQAIFFDLVIDNFAYDLNSKSAKNKYLQTGEIDESNDYDKDTVKLALDAFEYMKSIPAPMIEFLSKNFRKLSEIKETMEFKELLPKYDIERRQGGAFNPYRNMYSSDDVEKIFLAMVVFVKRLDAVLADGDLLIIPGNTGQYLGEALKVYSKKKITIITLAISGAPGYRTKEEGSRWEWARNILTPDGFDNYKKYVNQKLYEPLKNIQEGRKIHILDIVSGGYGVSFLIKCIEKIGFKDRDFNIINMDKTYIFSRDTNKMMIHRYHIDFKDLSAYKEIVSGITDTAVVSGFDTIGREYRLMPDFPAYLWDDWKANDPDKFDPSDKAKKFVADIKEYFEKSKE